MPRTTSRAAYPFRMSMDSRICSGFCTIRFPDRPMSYHARMTYPLLRVTGRCGAWGNTKRTAKGSGSSGTMDSKSWPSAPRPCSQIMLAVGFFPVSTSTGGASTFATVNTACRASLAYNDLRQPRQARLETLPNPARQHLARWIFESLDIVQATVIKLLVKRLKRASNIGEVLHPTFLRRHRPGDVYLDMERVPVQPAALVPFRNIRQVVCGLEGKDLENFHAQTILSKPLPV